MPLLDQLLALASKGPNKAKVPESDDPPVEDGVITHSGKSFFVPGAWMKAIAINEDEILARGGGAGLKLYDELLDDDVAMSNFQQRRLAVICRDWEVEPGDPDDSRSVAAADHLRKQLKNLAWDRISDKMLYGIWHGYSVAEGLIGRDSDGLYILEDLIVADRSVYGFTNEGELRFRPGYSSIAEELPPNKFWVMRSGGSHDFVFYGLGLAHWCYWPIWFKRAVIKFWAFYLEKLGYPTVVGETKESMNDAEKSDLMKALVAIGRDRAARVPEGYVKDQKIKLFEPGRSGSGSSSYLDFITEQNEALMRVILGQPGTSKATPQGIGGGQAEVHEGVKKEIVKADSDLLCESFNEGFPKWLTRWNFGEDVAPPRVYRKLDDEEDLNSVAERDNKLNSIGIERTDESIEETYGPGYQRKEPEETPPQLVPPANDDEEEDEREERRLAFAARDVEPLYVYRNLKNRAIVMRWAREQGIPNLVPASELHVTTLYSREPVDWFKLSDGWEYNREVVVSPGGARKIERFDGGAIVLRFANDQIEGDHRRKIEQGASHDFDEFLPHVTIGFDPDGNFDLDSVEPYVGELVFGPEMFEELREFDPFSDLELAFTAGEDDAIERLAAMLAKETSPVLLEFGSELQDALEGIKSPEAARIALLEAFERMPAERMADLAGLAFVAERMIGEAGLEE